MNRVYSHNYYLGKSQIHGTGVIAKRYIPKDSVIGLVIYYKYYLWPEITNDFGIWVNHTYNPNSMLYYHARSNKYYLIALRDIQAGEEIAANYDHTPWFINKPEPHYT